MVQEYIQQKYYGSDNYYRLYYKELAMTVSQFNYTPTVKANGISVELTWDAESYAYYAILKYKRQKIQFLIYPDKRWGLGDTILVTTEAEYAYHTAWNLWSKFIGFKR